MPYLARPSATSHGNMASPHTPRSSGVDLASFRVMVVDDSRMHRKVLVRELNSMGIANISEAPDGLAALEQLKKSAVDLMLLDMEMPELDGLGVLELLQSGGHMDALSVIVISGAEELGKTIRCIEIGAEDYLPKPFNPVLFKARIL